MKKQYSILTVAVVSIILVVFAAFLEMGAAVCASATIFAAYGLFCTLLLLPFLIRKASVLKFACYALVILSLVILYFVPWNSRKPFLRDFEKIGFGMTVSEVEVIMSDYIKGTGWPAIPNTESSEGTLTDISSEMTMKIFNNPAGEMEIQNSIVYRHSNEGAFNSDWGIVKFEEGRVVGKIFMPD